ncbi:unnamed protein product [Allacma fusca]|uniref:Uncharacterized protein n=1 Tax=Allacma fusca TaxID=39272 RepID=A0A8J2K497_9HEXA|nr:unnamed protein product [Allacma fusca]
MNTLVDTYIQNFEILCKDHICFEPNQFEDFHQQNLKKAKSSTNYVDWDRKKMYFLCDQVIGNYKKNLQKQNSAVCDHEGRIAKNAHDHAVEKYKDFMNQKTSSTTLTEPELQHLHQCASERILSLFASNLPVPHTQPWLSQKLKLEQSLASLLEKQKQKNHNHLKKVILAKKEGFNAGKIRFQEVMERSFPATKVSDKILSDCDGIAMHQAILRLKESVAHIHQQISTPWEEEFKDTLVDLKQQYINDNRNKKDTPITYSAAVRQDVEIIHQSPVGHSMNKTYGIGLYVSLNKICVGVITMTLRLMCLLTECGKSLVEKKS